jgi:hypothetical protein
MTGPPTWDWFSVFGTCLAVNFLGFFIVSWIAGGDALSGYRTADQWFLGARGHFIAVDRGFWIYSVVHAVVTIGSFVIFFAWHLYRTVWKGHS